MALVYQLHATSPHQRIDAELLARFDQHRSWLAARAEESPANLAHLVRWLDAERAWITDDFQAAIRGFDSAIRGAAQRRRRWHHAVIAERSALFHLANDLEHGGVALLTEARREYEAWGAVAKVAQIDQRHPELRFPQHQSLTDSVSNHLNNSFSPDRLDLLGVLNASQALSGETNLTQLRERVESILSSMTGATSVHLVVWHDDLHNWFVTLDQDLVPVDVAAKRGTIPLSVFRYVERTREPLVVAGLVGDERFGRDPYCAGLDSCSLLVVPVVSRGEPKAMLILENRLSRAAFTADRLDSVLLITGQLAVSLDNALLYASLERKVAERTRALDLAAQRLEALSITDSLTGLANRRRLANALNQEWIRAIHLHSHLAIAMIDIDHFKLFNDRYGHIAGDHCLRLVAAVLNESVRSTDVVARYGGEEFLIVMPGVNLPSAAQVAQRVRAAVANLRQPHELSPFGIVTVSIGVAATLPAEGTIPDPLVEEADNQLYRAKNQGRNQVVR